MDYIRKEDYIQEWINIINQKKPNKYDRAGVYCIKIDNILVYIGKSHQMDKRLAQHIAAINYVGKAQECNCNKYKVLREAKEQGRKIEFDTLYKGRDIHRMEGILIRHYKPPLNYQIPKNEDTNCFTVNPEARTITLEEIIERAKQSKKKIKKLNN